MMSAVEALLGDHIIGGVASLPVDTMRTARTNFPQYIPTNSRIR